MYQISSFWNNPNKCLTGMVNQIHSLATNLIFKNLLRLGKGLQIKSAIISRKILLHCVANFKINKNFQRKF